MYRISEDNETVQVIVSTNGEHLLPVMFEIILTNDSAISKSSTNAMCSQQLSVCIPCWLVCSSEPVVRSCHLCIVGVEGCLH